MTRNLFSTLTIAAVLFAGILALISSITPNGSLLNELCAILSAIYLMTAFATGMLAWLR